MPFALAGALGKPGSLISLKVPLCTINACCWPLSARSNAPTITEFLLMSFGKVSAEPGNLKCVNVPWLNKKPVKPEFDRSHPRMFPLSSRSVGDALVPAGTGILTDCVPHCAVVCACMARFMLKMLQITAVNNAFPQRDIVFPSIFRVFTVCGE